MQIITRHLLTLFLLGHCSILMAVEINSDQEGGGDILSVTGEILTPIEPSDLSLANLAAARVAFQKNPQDPDLNIWLGRRMAYTGNYHEDIKIFSDGIKKYPNDPRFYRHRGHRYISIRQFDQAIEDLTKATTLMENLHIEIEPDGLPNSQNIRFNLNREVFH